MTRIIIDSTIDLPEQYRRQVHIVPLTIHFGTEELLDGVAGGVGRAAHHQPALP